MNGHESLDYSGRHCGFEDSTSVQTSPIGASPYSPKLVANSVINSATYGCSGTWQKRRKVPSFLRAEPGSVAVSSSPGAVVEVDHAVAETAFAQQFELHADIVGEGPFAASHHDGRDEQMVLVDQPGPERLGGEVGTAHDHVPSRRRLHLPYRFGVELSLDPRPGGGYCLQRPGVHDLVGGLPELREVAHKGRLLGEGVVVLPTDHRLVHPASVEVGA